MEVALRSRVHIDMAAENNPGGKIAFPFYPENPFICEQNLLLQTIYGKSCAPWFAVGNAECFTYFRILFSFYRNCLSPNCQDQICLLPPRQESPCCIISHKPEGSGVPTASTGNFCYPFILLTCPKYPCEFKIKIYFIRTRQDK